MGGWESYPLDGDRRRARGRRGLLGFTDDGPAIGGVCPTCLQPAAGPFHIGPPAGYVPEHQLAAARMVAAEREAELLELKGPCSNRSCGLHRAHRGPCAPERAPGG